MLFILCAICSFLRYTRIQLDSLFESLDALLSFSQSIPYKLPSSSEDEFKGRGFFLLFFFLLFLRKYSAYSLLNGVDSFPTAFDLNFTVMPIFLCRSCAASLWGRLDRVFFNVVPKDLRLFSIISGAVQHSHVTPRPYRRSDGLNGFSFTW